MKSGERGWERNKNRNLRRGLLTPKSSSKIIKGT
jgi:hypothetical protein